MLGFLFWGAGPDVALLRATQLWCIGSITMGFGWAFLATVTRPPSEELPNHPPRPRGLASGPALLLAIAIVCLVKPIFDDRAWRLSPQTGFPCLALVQVPLALLAFRSGARAARVRFGSGLLSTSGGLAGILLLIWERSVHVPGYFYEAGFCVIHGWLGGLAGSRTLPALNRARWPLTIGIALIATVAGKAYPELHRATERRLRRQVDRLGPDALPTAEGYLYETWPMRRARLGKGSGDRDPSGRKGIVVRALAPNDRLTKPPRHPGFFNWAGRLSTGEARVATLSRSVQTSPRWVVVTETVGLRRVSQAKGPTLYQLHGLEPPLTLEATLDFLQANRPTNLLFLGLGLEADDPWTAQELFALCAQYRCTYDRHRSHSWDTEVARRP